MDAWQGWGLGTVPGSPVPQTGLQPQSFQLQVVSIWVLTFSEILSSPANQEKL